MIYAIFAGTMNTDYMLKIGTRESPLAMWQATHVQRLLADQGIQSTLVPVKSEGDIDLVTPLYAMGVQGVFTKTLDAYLLSGYIDIAVHSMKDVPVQLAQGISQGAVLERGLTQDVIVWKDEPRSASYLQAHHCTIGTGSIRRSSQWLRKYPHHTIENLRGNVQTRLQKLADSHWEGAIFAAAGLDRMEFQNLKITPLDWMIHAPAQGAIMVVARSVDTAILRQLHAINHATTAWAVYEERQFLSILQGGCSTPIGAAITINGTEITFNGCITNVDGKEEMKIELRQEDWTPGIGERAALELLNQGAAGLIASIKAVTQK